MPNHQVVSQEKWINARRNLLAKEKEFTRLRDELSRQRRELPWVKVDKKYIFDAPGGKQTLGHPGDLLGEEQESSRTVAHM